MAPGAASMSVIELLRPLTKQIARTFKVPIFVVEDGFGEEPQASTLATFCQPDGPSRVMVYQQKKASATGADKDGDDDDEDVRIILSPGGELDRFSGKGVLLVKASEETTLDSAVAVDESVSLSVVLGSPVKALLATMEHVFAPVLAATVKGKEGWGEQLTETESDDFFGAMSKYVVLMSEAVNGVESSIELEKPTLNAASIELTPKGLARAAGSSDTVEGCEGAVRSWCDTVEGLVAAGPPPSRLVVESDAGPSSELEYWKTRLGRFTALSEQLRSHECQAVLGVLGQVRSPSMRRWKHLDEPMTNASIEAKDNVKFLSTLEKFVEPLYSGSPLQVIECLPGLLANLKMTRDLSRYFNSNERMTTILAKVTNQICMRCIGYIEGPGKLWDQPALELLERLSDAISIEEEYRSEYANMVQAIREGAQAAATHRPMDLDERLVFGKLELLTNRMSKLSELFATVEQFTQLSKHQVREARAAKPAIEPHRQGASHDARARVRSPRGRRLARGRCASRRACRRPRAMVQAADTTRRRLSFLALSAGGGHGPAARLLLRAGCVDALEAVQPARLHAGRLRRRHARLRRGDRRARASAAGLHQPLLRDHHLDRHGAAPAAKVRGHLAARVPA